MAVTEFPADKNTYTLNDTIIRQTECQTTFGLNEAKFTLRFLGKTDDAVSLASHYREGTRVPKTFTTKFAELSGADTSNLQNAGKVVSSTCTTKKGSGQTTVMVSIPYVGKITPEDEPQQTKTVVWTERATKYEFPLEVYAGDVSANSTEFANAGAYQGWLNENGQDAELYSSFEYSLPDTAEIIALSGNTLELAKKHYGGIDNVTRAYPEVIRTTRYQYIKGDEGEADATVIRKIDETPHLYEIDGTPSAVWNSKFPNVSWLKSAYDVELQETEYVDYWNATVVESWIGISIAERGAWDKNLYGTGADRWKFYTAASGNN